MLRTILHLHSRQAPTLPAKSSAPEKSFRLTPAHHEFFHETIQPVTEPVDGSPKLALRLSEHLTRDKLSSLGFPVSRKLRLHIGQLLVCLLGALQRPFAAAVERPLIR